MQFQIKDLVVRDLTTAEHHRKVPCDGECYGQSINCTNLTAIYGKVLDALPGRLRQQLTEELVKLNETTGEPKSRQDAEELEGRLESALAEVRKIKKGFDVS